MKIKGIDHIAIAVKNLEETLSLYESALKLKIQGVEDVENQGVRVALIPLGESRIELVCPISANASVGKFLESKGEGIHHLALKVDDIEGALRELQQSGLQLIDSSPRVGAGGKRIAFVHPRSIHGVLLELCEDKD